MSRCAAHYPTCTTRTARSKPTKPSLSLVSNVS